MEHVKPSYTAPVQQQAIPPMPQPKPIVQPIYQPMPMPAPVHHHHKTVVEHVPMPMHEKPVHNDIHLHASYQQTAFIFPPPKPPMHKPMHHHKPVAVSNCNNMGAILVLFILLVIITRSFRRC
ncbi:hypothetical protein [Paenibacillus eucommiae]|uniref:Uncharacterized protein n=1 Tax=Paenibacillus eucommiae TaxID=1355755 RepID=A0ABS4ITK6_9BACL|nr:hypothetical protein [Paenibacillus eucommiae]MBP1990904.1 hypothetical protein [Paenibacillus eucommiae]